MSFPPSVAVQRPEKTPLLAESPSVAPAPQAGVAPRGSRFQDWPPSVQAAFCGQRLRTVSATLTSYVDVWKIGSNAMPVSQVDAGPDRDAHIGRHIVRDFSR